MVIVVALLAAGGGGYAMQRVGPTYSASATVLLVPPPAKAGQGASAVPDNPYLSLGGLTPARDILIRTLTSQSVRLDVHRQYPAVAYTMFADQSVAGPIIALTVTAPNGADVLAGMTYLLKQTPTQLSDLQVKLRVDPEDRISSETLTQDPKPEAVHKTQMRMGILGAGAILVLGLLLVGLVDGLIVSRRRIGEDTVPARGQGRRDAGSEPELTSAKKLPIALDRRPRSESGHSLPRSASR